MQTLKDIIKLLNADPYDVLQSKPEQDFNTLKKNYRSLALRYHPDRNKQEEAKEKFILINLAYQFLQKEQNRQIYQNHLKGLEEQKKRIQKMDDNRKKLIQDLKRQQDEYNRRKKDMDEQLKKRKQFFQKKMQQQEQREKLRQEILQQIKPHQYYEQLTSIKVQWQKGISFSKFLLQNAFSEYGKISNIKIEPKHKQAIVSFNSIEVCTETVKNFNHLLITIDYLVDSERREYLMKAMKRQKTEIDFSLTSDNLARLKDVLNRSSKLYYDDSAR